MSNKDQEEVIQKFIDEVLHIVRNGLSNLLIFCRDCPHKECHLIQLEMWNELKKLEIIYGYKEANKFMENVGNKKPNLLIVEDNSDVIKLYQDTFLQCNVNLITVDTMMDIEKTVKGINIDVAIIDLYLDDDYKAGLFSTKFISPRKCIVVSAYLDNPALKAIGDHGITSIIQKPFSDINLLVSTVQAKITEAALFEEVRKWHEESTKRYLKIQKFAQIINGKITELGNKIEMKERE